MEYLGKLRWPNGFSCPQCSDGHCWRTGRGLWMCAGCGLKTSATAGTIFHRSHTPPSTRFAAIWFVTSQKNGVSAKGLEGALGFGSYETASAWLHKLRPAMVRPDRELLGGVVELDQSFLGGRSTVMRGASSDKAPITIAVERDDRGRLGRVRLVEELGLADAMVAPGARGAYVWSCGRRRPLPPSTLSGVPQRLLPLLRSGLRSPLAIARAALLRWNRGRSAGRLSTLQW